MGKGQYRDRGRRRRGFDDDHFSPQDARESRESKPFAAPSWEAPAAQTGPSLDAVVKMFNSEKGFGFVELADGSGDAFLHIGVLQAAGHDAPNPGTKLRVQVGQGQKGQQITAVLEVDASSAVAPRPAARASAAGPRPGRPDPASAIELEGTVKWFNPEKGFGFAQVADGGKDVFLHISVVENAGLSTLNEGAPISMRVVEGHKGREAISIAMA